MLPTLVAATFVASLSLIGIFFFRKNTHITGTHRFIIPIALGMFLGIVFFELIPETLEANEAGSFAIVGGFLAFYLLSHLLRSYHHHQHEHEERDPCAAKKSSASLILVGDAIHNVADGVVIASAFLINPTLGIATTIGVALHEIPQEIAEFGMLIHSGYTKKQAALYNLLSASSIIIGVLICYVFLNFGDYLWIVTGIAAGNLLYIAASDMIPELHGDAHRRHFAATFTSTLIGLAIILTLLTFVHEEHNASDEPSTPDLQHQIAH